MLYAIEADKMLRGCKGRPHDGQDVFVVYNAFAFVSGPEFCFYRLSLMEHRHFTRPLLGLTSA